MTDLHASMIAEARARHGQIAPCSGRADLSECFTQEEGMILFWCNSPDGSTRLIIRRTSPCPS